MAYKQKYTKSSFPFKSPIKHVKGVRMTDPPQYHYHEDGEVKWRSGKKTPKTTLEQHRKGWKERERRKLTKSEIESAKQLL